MLEKWVPSLSQEESLEEEIATHSNILAGKSHGHSILGSDGPWDHKRVGHDLVTEQQQFSGSFTLNGH